MIKALPQVQVLMSDREWRSETRISLNDTENLPMRSCNQSLEESVATEATLSMSESSLLKSEDITSDFSSEKGKAERRKGGGTDSHARSVDVKRKQLRRRRSDDVIQSLTLLSTSDTTHDHKNSAIDGSGRYSDIDSSGSLQSAGQTPSERSPGVGSVQRDWEDVASTVPSKAKSTDLASMGTSRMTSHSRKFLISLIEEEKETVSSGGHFSDTLHDETDDLLVKRLPRRTSSAIDFCLGSHEKKRDHCPRAPQRRSDVQGVSTPKWDNSAGIDSSTRSCPELKSHVMSQIPTHLLDQLPKEEWDRIFSVLSDDSQSSPSQPSVEVPDSTQNNGSSELKEYDEVESVDFDEIGSCDEDDVFSVDVSMVSGLTGLVSPTKGKDQVLKSALVKRSWNGGAAMNERAPRIPSRANSTEIRRTSEHIPRTIAASNRVAPRRSISTDAVLDGAKRDPFHKIQFGQVHVRYFERILDVNPSTSSGPSVGLGWRYEDEHAVKDLRFHLKDEVSDHRRVLLSRSEREEILADLGYPRSDIVKAIRLNLKLKGQRAQTYNNLKHEKVEYLFEKSKRKVGKLLSFRPSIPPVLRSSRRPSLGKSSSDDVSVSSSDPSFSTLPKRTTSLIRSSSLRSLSSSVRSGSNS